MSSIYLSYLNKQSHAQQLSTSTNFMSKHKISVNIPAQAHYTAQGVQLYAPQQIKALKQKQDRLMQGKDGIYAQPKVYILSDQIMDDTDAYEQNKQKKNKTRQKKERVQSADPSKKRQVKTSVNTRNAVSTNNQVIVKLEKQMVKRNSLQSQLDKMAKKYKQHFKIEQKSKKGDKKQKLQQSEIIQNQQPTSNRSLSNNNIQNLSQNQKLSKTTKNVSSTTKNQSNKLKQNQKLNSKNETTNKNKVFIKNPKKQNIQQTSQIVQFSQQQEQQNESNSNLSLNLNLGLDLINKSTTYSQKLGTAIFQMFK